MGILKNLEKGSTDSFFGGPIHVDIIPYYWCRDISFLATKQTRVYSYINNISYIDSTIILKSK